MADHQWIKNLADACFKPQTWFNEGEKQGKNLAIQRFNQIMIELYHEAQEACEIFNSYATPQKQIRLLQIKDPATNKNYGFMLLLGKTQIILRQEQAFLEEYLAWNHYFRSQKIKLHRFEPQIDQFGTLFWRMENGLHLNHELIIKTLLQDLCHASFYRQKDKKP